MRKILFSAAAIAMAATGALAEPGKGNGGGNGGNGKASQGPAMKGPEMRGNGGDKGPAMKAAKPDRGPSMKEAKADRGPPMKAAKDTRGPSMKADRADRGPNKADFRDDRGNDRRVDRGTVRNGYDARDNGRYDTVRRVAFDNGSYGLIDGCPPGLAKKNNGCTPPGLAKGNDGYRLGYYSPSYFGYRSLGDGRYFYDDGYLYRMGGNDSILGYLPLLGGALSVGNVWPTSYGPASVPPYYVDYYNLGPADSYRYADNVLYRVEPQSNAITSIAALLTGDQFAVGQPMPSGYDVYNVPYEYRDQYYDTPESRYRYSDGYVYQVDPTTQLIQAAIQLLT